VIGQRLAGGKHDDILYDPAFRGAYWKHEGGGWMGTWLAIAPNGLLANLAAHTVIEHEDGTITVSPSIEVSTPCQPRTPENYWHGFLEQGVWRSA